MGTIRLIHGVNQHNLGNPSTQRIPSTIHTAYINSQSWNKLVQRIPSTYPVTNNQIAYTKIQHGCYMECLHNSHSALSSNCTQMEAPDPWLQWLTWRYGVVAPIFPRSISCDGGKTFSQTILYPFSWKNRVRTPFSSPYI